ncbi:MAG: hypothetical protein IPM24_07420 [Bryobacterales bacterium]|nr:hypothetical protein [Bryobacterales bacterium]
MRALLGAVSVLLTASLGASQIIEFELNGVKYQTMTRNGLTVMCAPLQTNVKDYGVLQAAISNGSADLMPVAPEDFFFIRPDGTTVRGMTARTVVEDLMERGSRGDVVKLVSAYEASLYGMTRFRSSNGYERRRQAFLAEVHSTKLKAAAAASAIAFVPTKLIPGDSTDGAVFFANEGKPLGPGRLVVRNPAGDFEFPVDAPVRLPAP